MTRTDKMADGRCPRPPGWPRKLAILSIQSWVSYGHVGNASAMFPLQRLGMEVWAVNTVQFSNHPGYGAFTGQTYTGQAVRDLVDGIAARGVMGQCEAVLSGYLGEVGIGEAVLHAVAPSALRTRRRSIAAIPSSAMWPPESTSAPAFRTSCARIACRRRTS